MNLELHEAQNEVKFYFKLGLLTWQDATGAACREPVQPSAGSRRPAGRGRQDMGRWQRTTRMAPFNSEGAEEPSIWARGSPSSRRMNNITDVPGFHLSLYRRTNELVHWASKLFICHPCDTIKKIGVGGEKWSKQQFRMNMHIKLYPAGFLFSFM